MDTITVGQPRIEKRHRIVQTCNLTYCRVTFVTLCVTAFRCHTLRSRPAGTPATLPPATAESPSERRRPFGYKIIYHDLGEGSKRQRRTLARNWNRLRPMRSASLSAEC